MLHRNVFMSQDWLVLNCWTEQLWWDSLKREKGVPLFLMNSVNAFNLFSFFSTSQAFCCYHGGILCSNCILKISEFKPFINQLTKPVCVNQSSLHLKINVPKMGFCSHAIRIVFGSPKNLLIEQILKEPCLSWCEEHLKNLLYNRKVLWMFCSSWIHWF